MKKQTGASLPEVVQDVLKKVLDPGQARLVSMENNGRRCRSPACHRTSRTCLHRLMVAIIIEEHQTKVAVTDLPESIEVRILTQALTLPRGPQQIYLTDPEQRKLQPQMHHIEYQPQEGHKQRRDKL